MCGGGPKEKPEERARTKQIDQQMHVDHQKNENINKLLLLGAGESGKSTLFKQMQVVYGKGFGDDRNEQKQIVFSNIISGVKELLRASAELEGKVAGVAVSEANQAVKTEIYDLKENTQLDAELCGKIDALWKDPGIQTCYANRHLFQLPDSFVYFAQKISEIGAPGYNPSDDDILHSRVRTTGIVEETYTIEGNVFQIFDVGGQRNERKKWIHCFSEVTAMLFVAALSAYDLVLYEDESTNRMEEALKLFKDMANSKFFKKTSIICFLNKKDLFQEKIKTKPITVAECLKGYTGPQEYGPASQYIEEMFRAQVPSSRAIYIHQTCATDTGNMRKIFNITKDIVIKRSLDEGGLLGESF